MKTSELGKSETYNSMKLFIVLIDGIVGCGIYRKVIFQPKTLGTKFYLSEIWSRIKYEECLVRGFNYSRCVCLDEY